MSSPSREASREEDQQNDEDKLDFNILMRQLSVTPSTCSSIETTNSSKDTDIWPLHLNTLFVDHYIFGDVIGSGSYAEVRECIDTRNLERCAVKIVNKHYLKRQAPAALINQMQEISLLKRLKHPNVIAIKECLFKGQKIYIFLEHCTFVLHDLLREQPNNRLCVLISRNLFYQLILGLEYLHSIGCVHRDIKPQNLLITNCGILKIIDFGVSQLISIWNQDDTCSNYEGSPLFQAPEVVSGQAEYAGFKVDVWSAGVTLYLMLYGQHPFIDDSLLGLYDKILSQELKLPTKTHLQNDLACLLVLDDLLSSMLDKVHSNRASIQQILCHPWLKFQPTANSMQNNNTVEHHSEFIDLTSSSNIGNNNNNNNNNNSHTTQATGVGTRQQRDIYRSMSVLPYLYNHHFPDLSVTKAKPRLDERNLSSSQAATSSSDYNSSITPQQQLSKAPPSSASSSNGGGGSTTASSSSSSSVLPNAVVSPSPSVGVSPTKDSSNLSPQSIGSTVLNDPNQVIADRPIQWGNEEQYNLLKLPLIRANRVEYNRRGRGSNNRQQRRRQHRRNHHYPRGNIDG